MQTVSVNLRYRPLRFGWCVKKGDFAALRRAVKLSFTMWGGCFNPIIPIDDSALGEALIRLFRVDALAPTSDHDDVRNFIKKYKHLPWPFIGDELFENDMRGEKRARVVDISHPIEKLYEDHFRNNPNPQPGIDLVRWDVEDPLADMLLLSFGGVPDASEAGMDYLALAGQWLFGISAIIVNGAELPLLNVERMTLHSLNQAFLRRHSAVRNYWDHPGFYIGQADNFDDLVTFWNLRTADIRLKFHDVRYPERFRTVNAFWSDKLTKTLGVDRDFYGIALWHRREQEIANRAAFGARVQDCAVDDAIWNGGNVRVPYMFFGGSTTLASVGEGGETPDITFALTGQPFSQEAGGHDQHYVLSIRPVVGLFDKGSATLHTPFIPELNEFYGRHCHYVWNEARAEPDGLGIITSTITTDLSLQSMSVLQLIAQVFESVGIEATPSKAGLVGTTLIRQMGGLHGCRPFKVAGVRKLIENFRPDESFSRACAMQTIFGRDTDRPLSSYQWLFIEPRKDGSTLTNDAVLSYLLDRGVFRAGLKFACPSCQLDFWLSLDDAKSRLECEFCGHVFNASRQLRDKDWAFRRSGLFGRANNQEGAIPVTLTLQQLMHMHRLDHGIYTTAMDLKPKGATIPCCETDFVVLTTRGHDRKVQIAIGECKTRQPISADDVRKLKAVADAFPIEKYDVYIVFAKLNSFGAEEIESIKSVNNRYRRRAIMLTDRELEPYFVYERTEKDFDIKGTTVSFEEMAIITDRVFFQNMRREVVPPKGVTPGEELR